MRRVVRQGRSLGFGFLPWRPEVGGQSPFRPRCPSQDVEQRRIADTEVGDERAHPVLQLGEDGRAIEVHRHYGRYRRGDALDLLELRIAISETEIAFMLHRSAHVA